MDIGKGRKRSYFRICQKSAPLRIGSLNRGNMPTTSSKSTVSGSYSAVDEESRNIRTLGRWRDVRADLTLRPAATIGFSVVGEEAAGCEGPG